MKDFNAWLGDLTEALQADEGPTVDELRSIAEELRKNRAPKVDDHYIIAAPDPCTACGSAEGVCDCEEEAAGFAFFNRPIPGLWQDAEGTIQVWQGGSVGRVECPMTGNAMTSPEDDRPTCREPMTATEIIRLREEAAERMDENLEAIRQQMLQHLASMLVKDKGDS